MVTRLTATGCRVRRRHEPDTERDVNGVMMCVSGYIFFDVSTSKKM
ncbi:hypothetical protein ACFQO7_37235 [Catellatospora aurea]|uniref:Uncharacterized protein n=1 Tax=Catellatospora aurea TaxID=1337874 RepID=A0ABW2HBP1_9ACTN